MPRGAACGPLTLDRLGWRQFDDLCELLLELDAGVGRDAWTGGDGRDRHVQAVAGLSLTGVGRMAAPCHVQTRWLPARLGDSRAAALAGALGEIRVGAAGDGCVIVVSNVDTGPTPDPSETVGPARVQPLGPRWISDRVDALPGLRRALPSLLSTGALERWVPDELRRRCTLDVGAARALADVFVATSAHRRALTVLDAHHFVVLTGPPEMGKTTIARMIALALMTDGWEAHECTTPEQVLDGLDPARAQVFVADDAFGSTEYRPDAAERWARAMERLLPSMDDRHLLIWTSRPTPLHAGLRRIHRERGAERFPAPGAVLVDAGGLSLDEKVLIVLRHGQQAAPRLRHRLRAVGYELVSHPHFTPERIRRLVATPTDAISRLRGASPWEAIERELCVPTEAMAASFRALSAEQRSLLFALLDAPPGPVDHRRLAHVARVHHPGGLSRAPSELVDRLTDHFLRVTESLRVDWVHPSWRDLVIDELRADAWVRERFLSRCTLEGVLLSVSRGGGATGARALALLISDHDWDVLTDRVVELAGEASDRDVGRLLLALADATDEDPAQTQLDPGRERAELQALGSATLTAVSRRAARQERPVDLGVIGAWFALARRIDEEPRPLPVGITWTELRPGESVDLRHAVELERAILWLELIELLLVHAPEQLAAFGDREGHERRIEGLVAQAERLLAAGAVGARRPRLGQLLRLCRSLVTPSRAELSHLDRLIVEATETAPEPTLGSYSSEAGTRHHVELILKDL